MLNIYKDNLVYFKFLKNYLKLNYIFNFSIILSK